MQQDELREIKRIFNKIDINKDGSLTIDELRESLKNLSLYELFADEKLEEEKGSMDRDHHEQQVQRIMDMCDVDGDRHISF